MARVRAVLRRRGAIPQVLEVERLLVDEEHGFAARAGRDLGLTSTELRLLAFLIRHRGQALSKDQLLTQVWGYDAYDHNLVEVHISALRRKLEVNGAGGGVSSTRSAGSATGSRREWPPARADAADCRLDTRDSRCSRTFAVIITVRYRDGLEQRLRADLTSGASALRAAGTPEALKSVIGSLAAEGISVDLAGITGPGREPSGHARRSAPDRARGDPGRRYRRARDPDRQQRRDRPPGPQPRGHRSDRWRDHARAPGGARAGTGATRSRRLGGARLRGGNADVPGRRLTRAPHAGRRASRDRRAAPAGSTGAPGARRDRSPTRA